MAILLAASRTHVVRIGLCLTLGLLLGACGGDGDSSDAPEKPGAETPAATVEVPSALFVDAAPAGVVGIGDAKESAKEGDEIVLAGRIGGTHDPFVASRASFTIASAQDMKACDERADDGCATPWDYCCETPEDIVHYTVTVQVVGEDGRPLKTGLQGKGGLDSLKTVTVKGTVAARPSPEVLVVNATAIHVE